MTLSRLFATIAMGSTILAGCSSCPAIGCSPWVTLDLSNVWSVPGRYTVVVTVGTESAQCEVEHPYLARRSSGPECSGDLQEFGLWSPEPNGSNDSSANGEPRGVQLSTEARALLVEVFRDGDAQLRREIRPSYVKEELGCGTCPVAREIL